MGFPRIILVLLPMTEQPTTKVNVIQAAPQKPQNRKDLLIDAEIAYTRAIESGNPKIQIEAIKHFINIANGEISDEKYDSLTRLKEVDLDYTEYERQYFEKNPVLITEMKFAHYYRIREMYWHELLKRWVQEYAKVQALLKEETGWLFDQNKKETLSK